ncbi:beta-1,4-galactosyltransferase 4 [Paramormyrops kingsleyae]|uniref:Beta-1,4-galactosyltransferase n=1 Tax=Paramormyrops kingsleyae TaxID=1676925 RepID=A0A3B3T025_9TELE|nr:beta-1,4-galactosyltransferase 4 [Paramormyrops kingsleyae]XP_023656386.1 beta-1,4-galactosyltransferase 4 [Paramormyrops kingsleyae]
MSMFLALFKCLRKGKYFILILLSVSILAWIASFASDIVREVPNTLLLWSKTDKPTKNVMHEQKPGLMEELSSRKPHSDASTPSLQKTCPLRSPFLLGSVRLSFEPSLTMNDVESANSKLIKGQFQPDDCKPRQNVAILIPHRNREMHLLYLLHHLHPFLQRQQLHYGIYVIQQAGSSVFNRAKLLNVGFLEALKDYNWDCFVFHDVDLIPENDHNLYACERQPKHLVVGRNVTGYRLRYQGYFGGVTAMSKEQFSYVNGFSNKYWGWGGEDDDLRIRVGIQKMKVVRPPAAVGRYTMIFHKRDSGNAVNRNRMRLLERTRKIWKNDGINSCLYKMLSVERTKAYINVTVDISETNGQN